MRIASLQPSVSATLVSLGAANSLVACTKYCLDICPELRDRELAIIQDSWTAQASQIISASPDIVIASVPYQQKAVEEILKAGARFLGFSPRSLSDIYGDTRILAALADRVPEAESMIAKFRDELRNIEEKIADRPPLKVFSEEWGKPIIHSQGWVAELIETCGGTFLGTPGAHTTAEEIRQANPDVILAAWCGAGDRVPLEKIVRERQWEPTSATRNARVFCIADEFFNTPALPTLTRGLRAIAHALHPDLFINSDGIRQISALL